MENLFSSLKLFYKALSSGNELCTIDSFKEIKILCPNCLETWNFLLNDSDVLEQLIFRGIITFPNLLLGNSNFIETLNMYYFFFLLKKQSSEISFDI